MRTNYDYIFPSAEYRATISLEVAADELEELNKMADKVLDDKIPLGLNDKQVLLLKRLHEELWCSRHELRQYMGIKDE